MRSWCSKCVPVCATPAVPAAALILQQCPESCLPSPREWDGPRWIRLSARETPSPLVLPLHPAASSPLFANSTGCTSDKQTTGAQLIKGLSDPHSPPLPAEEGSSGHAPAKSHVPNASRPPRPRERGRPRTCGAPTPSSYSRDHSSLHLPAPASPQRASARAQALNGEPAGGSGRASAPAL